MLAGVGAHCLVGWNVIPSRWFLEGGAGLDDAGHVPVETAELVQVPSDLNSKTVLHTASADGIKAGRLDQTLDGFTGARIIRCVEQDRGVGSPTRLRCK